jgi:putative transposase
MSRRGDCLDNAPMESFFASPKKEHVYPTSFGTREEAEAAVFDNIEVFYIRQRLHSRIGYRTPVQARADMTEIGVAMAA